MVVRRYGHAAGRYQSKGLTANKSQLCERLRDPRRLNQRLCRGSAAAAQQSDVAIVFVGEAKEMVGEAASRSSLDLPGRQMDLVKAIQATGKPTVVVLVNGRPPTIGWIVDNVPAILESLDGWNRSGQCHRRHSVRRR